jgi:hypothetical protein
MRYKEITNVSIKKDAINYFFDMIENFYEYRYMMLKTLDDLQRNEKNIEYVIPHIKGETYIMVIGTIGRTNFVYLIDKRKLKYSKDQCNIAEIKVYNCSIKTIPKAYLGTIFDGRMIKSNDEDIFLIQDCYYLEGIKMNAWKLEKKIEYIDEYISKNLKGHNIKIRKMDLISNIVELNSKIDKSTVDINGFIFLQARSGVSYIFIDNEFKKEINSNINIEEKLDKEFIEDNNNPEENVFLIKKDAKPDVYHIYDENNTLIHFASIPDTITSQLCYDALKNVDSAQFKCIMCPKWNRYKPIECVS